MNFLEAHKLVAGFTGGPALPFLLAMSGTPDTLDVFIKAAAAKRGRSVAMRTLPFNTLGQALMNDGASNETEVFVLFPWDFVPEADWRSGLPTRPLDFDALLASAQGTAARVTARGGARTIYVPAPLPPLFADATATSRLAGSLMALAIGMGAELLDASTFSCSSYLSNGSPFASAALGAIAEAIVARAASVPLEPKKVLVTDLDNVMWRGIVGEDGFDGIHYLPEGPGFRHFVYQTFLAKLKREGTLLAAVSRNDAELANAPFLSGRMTLHVDDFVVIVASYSAKSSQIREIARQLNLGLDSFVFVDDNPIEIEEVSAALPDITAVRFPPRDDTLPVFFADVAALFRRPVITAEDTERTAMYRRRLDGMVPVQGDGADLTGFLRGLGMSLTIHDRSSGDRTRAVQLINKTNQFNLNGRRVTDDEVGAMLSAGGRLYTSMLEDRTGSHGEILSCLIDRDGVIRSLVMSCRVFQRRVEYAFFLWLAGQASAPHALEFARTARNEPITQFFQEPGFEDDAHGIVRIDWNAFARSHSDVPGLFTLATPALA
ncbi:MAG: HAD-IIIC family phosphatase [Gemmatimonadaceae bacterium]